MLLGVGRDVQRGRLSIIGLFLGDWFCTKHGKYCKEDINKQISLWLATCTYTFVWLLVNLEPVYCGCFARTHHYLIRQILFSLWYLFHQGRTWRTGHHCPNLHNIIETQDRYRRMLTKLTSTQQSRLQSKMTNQISFVPILAFHLIMSLLIGT